MRHSRDDPKRDQQHGVFEVESEDDLLRLIDRAFHIAGADKNRVRINQQDDRYVYTVNMKKRVGYVGGIVGKRKGFPECQFIRIVVEDKNIMGTLEGPY